MATASIAFDLVGGCTSATKLYAAYPLKLLLPTRSLRHREVDCAWVYLLGYGGGLLSCDKVQIECHLSQGTSAVLTTQGSTKVYKRKRQEDICTQRLECTVAASAFIAILPGPVTCFRDANFDQKQIFRVAAHGSLVLVDWYTSGREGYGESWEFARFENRNEVYIGDELVVFDRLLLDRRTNLLQPLEARMHGLRAVGMVVLIGPQVARITKALLESEDAMRQHFSGLAGSYTSASPARKLPSLLSSTSPLRDSLGVIVRFACDTTEGAYEHLAEVLAPLEGILGGRPYTADFS